MQLTSVVMHHPEFSWDSTRLCLADPFAMLRLVESNCATGPPFEETKRPLWSCELRMPFYSRFDHYQKNATASALQSMQAPPPPYFNVWHFQTSTATLDSCLCKWLKVIIFAPWRLFALTHHNSWSFLAKNKYLNCNLGSVGTSPWSAASYHRLQVHAMKQHEFIPSQDGQLWYTSSSSPVDVSARCDFISSK